MAKQNDKPMTFEEALTELDRIVTQVEQGKIGLEESIAQYEKGMGLIKHCRAILDQAEKRIEIIGKDAEVTGALPEMDDDAAGDEGDG